LWRATFGIVWTPLPLFAHNFLKNDLSMNLICKILKTKEINLTSVGIVDGEVLLDLAYEEDTTGSNTEPKRNHTMPQRVDHLEI
jgi:hypothetical protein